MVKRFGVVPQSFPDLLEESFETRQVSHDAFMVLHRDVEGDEVAALFHTTAHHDGEIVVAQINVHQCLELLNEDATDARHSVHALLGLPLRITPPLLVA